MPRFTQHDERYCISYVTGPSHVWLGVKFGLSPSAPRLVRRPAIGECYHGAIDEGRISDAVRAALEAVKENSGSEFHAKEIAYVENDSPRYDLYRLCAKLIAERLMSGEPFADDR